jgi:DNA-binding transcriptional LysR family regulator
MDNRRRPRLSLDLLRGFRVAARHLSFTRAAQELFVTQPAISREIKTLESQLGQPLFRRVNRALQLTEAGQQLYRATDEALGLLDAALDRIASPGNTIALTTTPALASTWLVPHLPHFARLHPEFDVRLVASNDMLDLEREQLDVAIRYVQPGADMPKGELLVDYMQFPVCSPAYRLEHARTLRTPEDLAGHVLLDFETILYGRPWYDWEQWLGAMKMRRFKPAGYFRFSHYDQVVHAAIEGSGVMIGKRPHLTGHLRDGRLCAPFGDEHVARLGGFYIVHAAGAAERPPVKTFVSWLKHEMQEDAVAARGTEGASGRSSRRSPKGRSPRRA